MFHVVVLNDKNEQIIGNLDIKAKPSEYFAGLVYILIDLWNGGTELHKLAQQEGYTGEKGSTFASQASAIVFFISELHRHPAFDPKVIFQKNHPYYPVFAKINSLLQLTVQDTSTHFYFIEILKELKIEGVGAIQFTHDFTESHAILYQCNFPDEYIPDEYLCLLTGQIMDEPCCDKNIPDQFFDKNKLFKALSNTGKNPYTKTPLSNEDVITNEKLSEKIKNFLRKVILIPQNFPETYNEQYKKYKAQICGEMSHNEFEEEIKKDVEKQKSALADKTTLTAMNSKNKNPNALTLYNEAIKNLKDKNYDLAAAQLEHATKKFKEIRGEFSEECFKCFSSLISCYRDVKNYTKAIQISEEVITKFNDKFDLRPIIKKYHDCLKLNETSAKTIYDEAVSNYKAGKDQKITGKFLLAIEKLLFATSIYSNESKNYELSSCHSTIASCYREVGDLDKAIDHCEQALNLRKQLFKETDSRVQEVEKKLQSLKDAQPKQNQNDLKS